MEQFEGWLKEHDVVITGQAATGSGDVVVYQLRLVDGYEFTVNFSLSELVERPERAIDQVRITIDGHTRDRHGGNGAWH